MHASARETVTKPLHDHWRQKVVVARRQYIRTPTTEAKSEYVRTLAVFADLVLRNKAPAEPENLQERIAHSTVG